jgi:hypothetical protein
MAKSILPIAPIETEKELGGAWCVRRIIFRQTRKRKLKDRKIENE